MTVRTNATRPPDLFLYRILVSALLPEPVITPFQLDTLIHYHLDVLGGYDSNVPQLS
jgi:hypothetical protein